MRNMSHIISNSVIRLSHILIIKPFPYELNSTVRKTPIRFLKDIVTPICHRNYPLLPFPLYVTYRFVQFSFTLKIRQHYRNLCDGLELLIM